MESEARLISSTRHSVRWSAGRSAALLLTAALGLAACAGPGDHRETAHSGDDQELSSRVLDWRTARLTSLQGPEGWLSLVGLHWLGDQSETLGSDSRNDIVLSGGPPLWGRVIHHDDHIVFQPAVADIRIENGITDDDGYVVLSIGGEDSEPTVLRHGPVSLTLIERGDHALRERHHQAPTRMDFVGLDYYPIRPQWQIEAQFEPAPEGATVDIANVLGQISPQPQYGTAVFNLRGKTHRLIAVGEADAESLFFIFGDRTNGQGSYGAGRFLYSDPPVDGRLTLNFNQAYNPPCAFTEYSTCPLPPPENRLDLAVEAGEKRYLGMTY